MNMIDSQVDHITHPITDAKVGRRDAHRSVCGSAEKKTGLK